MLSFYGFSNIKISLNIHMNNIFLSKTSLKYCVYERERGHFIIRMTLHYVHIHSNILIWTIIGLYCTINV